MQSTTESAAEEKKETRKGRPRNEPVPTEGLVEGGVDVAELREWAEKAKDVISSATRTLRETARRRPELALGVALGVGFILGGGLSTRLGRMTLLGAVELGLKQTHAGRSLFS